MRYIVKSKKETWVIGSKAFVGERERNMLEALLYEPSWKPIR
jgi:hypothetical protein